MNSRSSFRVPPYAITRGRTQIQTELAIETIVSLTEAGESAAPGYEKDQILDLCCDPQSIAEISAHIKLPLQVVKVLVDDLIQEGSLMTGSGVAYPESNSNSGTGKGAGGRPDLDLLERVLGGLQNL